MDYDVLGNRVERKRVTRNSSNNKAKDLKALRLRTGSHSKRKRKRHEV